MAVNSSGDGIGGADRKVASIPAVPADAVEVVPGYHVTPRGEVWSTMRQTPRRLRFKWNEGYAYITIHEDAKPKSVAVHTLVLIAFHGKAPAPNYCCRHLDGNRSNNTAGNLRWGTPAENSRDTELHGRHATGEKNGSARLNAEQVIEVRRRFDKGESVKTIALSFNVDAGTITAIGNRRTWKHIPDQADQNTRRGSARNVREWGTVLASSRKESK